MDIPKVTIYIPMYNSARFIKETVQSCLDQTYTDFELLLIDDCSTDNTLEIVESIKDDRIVIIKSDKNQGIAATSNIAIENARGEYIARLDHDDLMFPDRIKIEVEYLDNNPDIVMVGGNMKVLNSETGDSYNTYYDHTDNMWEQVCELLHWTLVSNSTTMYRRNFIISNGIRHDTTFKCADDIQFQFDITKCNGRIQQLDDLLITRIEHGDNTSFINLDKNYEEIRKLGKTIFDYIYDNWKLDSWIVFRKFAKEFIKMDEPEKRKKG